MFNLIYSIWEGFIDQQETNDLYHENIFLWVVIVKITEDYLCKVYFIIQGFPSTFSFCMWESLMCRLVLSS
jgi:hypothetical protein